MHYLEIPESPVLHGKDAIEALHKYIAELDRQTNTESADRQKATLKRIAKALISALENEETSQRQVKKPGFLIELGEIKKTILRPLQGSNQEETQTISIQPNIYPYSQPPIAQQIQQRHNVK